MERPKAHQISLVAFLLMLGFFLAISLWMMRPYLLAVLMGVIFSLLFRGVYLRILEVIPSPGLSAALVTLLLLLLVIGPLTLFVTLAIKQAIGAAQSISEHGNLNISPLLERLGTLPGIRLFVGDAAAIESQLQNEARVFAKSATGWLLNAAASVPALLLQLALELMTCFFLLTDGPRFSRWMSDKIPLSADVRVRLALAFQGTAVSVILATVVSAAVQAAIMCLGFIILGIPEAFLAAGATFILAFVPVIGSVPVWVVGAIYLITQHEIAKTIAIVAIGLFAGISDNLVRPMVLRGHGSLHPLVSLLSVFGGVQMFGALGIFLGPIIAAVSKSLLEVWPVEGGRVGIVFERSEGGVAPSPVPLKTELRSSEKSARKTDKTE